MFNTNFASHSFSSSFCSQCLSVARLLKNNDKSLPIGFVLFSIFVLSIIVTLPLHTRLSCGVKFNRAWCSHACLLWYGSSRVSSCHRKRRIGIPNGSLLFSIGHLGRYLCCFYRTFTFFISKTDKTNSFQELWTYKRLTGRINLHLWQE